MCFSFSAGTDAHCNVSFYVGFVSALFSCYVSAFQQVQMYIVVFHFMLSLFQFFFLVCFSFSAGTDVTVMGFFHVVVVSALFLGVFQLANRYRRVPV